MAVAHVVSSASHASGSFSVSQASFSWTHTTSTDPQGVLVLVFQGVASTDAVTSVTYDGVTVPAVSGGRATDTATELGSVAAFFLGSGVPVTNNPQVQVNRTNNTTSMWAVCATQTAGSDTETFTPVLLQNNGTIAQQSVNDGSIGINSMRYAGVYYGGATPAPAGANSTLLHSNDAGAYGWTAVRETTAGQGSRLVGCTQGTSDDRAAVHLAVRETIPPVTGTAAGDFGFTSAAAGVPTVQGVASASFDFTATASGATGGGMAVTFLDSTTTGNTAFTSSRAIPVPTGGGALQADDVVVVRLSRWESSNPAVTTPAGTWVHRTQAVNGSGKIDTYLKRLTASDSGTYTFSWTGSMWTTGQAAAYRGVDPAADLSTIPLHQVTNSGTAWPAATLNSVSDGVLDWHGYSESGGTHTVPTTPAFTEAEDNDSDVHGYHINTAGNFTTSGGASSVSSPNIVSMLHLPAGGGGGTVNGAAVAAFGFTGAASGVDRALGAAAGAFGFTATAAGVDRALGVATASLGFSATAAGVDRAVGSAAGSFGFTATASGSVGTPPVTGTASGTFGFTASASGTRQLDGLAAAAFGFAAAASGVDRSLGLAVALFGFTGVAAGIDRSIGAAGAAFGFVATTAGVPDIHGAAQGSFGFTGAAQGFAGTPPVTGAGAAVFGFTAAAQGQPRTPGTAVAVFGFAAVTFGRPRVVAAAATSFSFTAMAFGDRETFGSAQGVLGFTAHIDGLAIPPVVYGTASTTTGTAATAEAGVMQTASASSAAMPVPTATGG